MTQKRKKRLFDGTGRGGGVMKCDPAKVMFADIITLASNRLEEDPSFGWNQCDQKKSPNVCKSCPKMIDFDTFTKIP